MENVWNEAKAMYGWKRIETMSYTHQQTKSKYMILMNDMGLYEDTEPNMCATKVMMKINLYWGVPVLTGSYVVVKYDVDEKGDTIWMDMDLTPKEFIKSYNEAIKATADANKEFFKNAVEIRA